MSISALATPATTAAPRTSNAAGPAQEQEQATPGRPSLGRLALGTAAFAGGTAAAGFAVDKLWSRAGYAKGSGFQYIGLLAIPAGAAYLTSIARNNSDGLSAVGGGMVGMTAGVGMGLKGGNADYGTLMFLMGIPAAQIGTMAAEKLAGVPNQNPPAPRS